MVGTTGREVISTCRRIRRWISMLVPLLLLVLPWPSTTVAASTQRVIDINQSLGRGVNLGNALEAPVEGEWGLTLEEDWFDTIARAGFDSVRVPIRWSSHAASRSPYAIDASFFERVDWVLAQTRRTGLATILNVHHYDELMDDPARERTRFLALWRQIAQRYAHQPRSVVFELLNEPHKVFNEDPAAWNELLASALDVVRRRNPTRSVMVGPTSWQSIDALDELVLPDDADLIVSVHFYEPFEFTHQGAGWVDPVPPTGVAWQGSLIALSGGIQDWSWDTRSIPGPSAMSVRYSRRHAGWSARMRPMESTSRLRLTARGDLDVNVGCSTDDGEFEFVDRIQGASSVWVTRTADLRRCPARTSRVALMNEGKGSTSFEMRVATVCGSRCQRLVSSATLNVVDRMRTLERWANRHQRPINIGEYGAYEAADLASRVRWTKTVQRHARRLGFSTHYWEFGAGFGLYEPQSRQWRPALRDAVLRAR